MRRLSQDERRRSIRRYTTPLRYPGGKQRLTQFFLEILSSNRLVGRHYAEPYAGGAGVGIELLISGNASHVHLNDCSEHIYAFWKTVKENPDDICGRIRNATLSVEAWKRHRNVVRSPNEHSTAEVGFSTFYLNRCNRSGVLNGGLIGGLEQKGNWLMDARFPRHELIRRIEDIAERSKNFTVTNLDATKFVTTYAETHLERDTLYYFDPPYYERADRLYYNSYEKDDHAEIAEVIQDLPHRNWVVSYDAHQDVMKHYANRRMFTYDLQYSAARAYKGREVFIFSDTLELPTESAIKAIHKGLKQVV
jgi:DNA adenine methylase